MDVFAHHSLHLLQHKEQGAQGHTEINVSLVHTRWE